MDEFVSAVMSRWPTAVLQFEDFNTAHALPLLERYRHHHCELICVIGRPVEAENNIIETNQPTN